MNTEILGVSRESIKSHENFKSKQNFPFELLSDPDEKVCKAFDVMKLKSMYGREYMGVDRSTFLINSKGKVMKEWRSVKVKGHVQEVLDTCKEISWIVQLDKFSGHEFQIALIKVAIGIAKIHPKNRTCFQNKNCQAL